MVTRVSCDGREVLDPEGSCVPYSEFRIMELQCEIYKITIDQLTKELEEVRAMLPKPRKRRLK